MEFACAQAVASEIDSLRWYDERLTEVAAAAGLP